MTGHHARAPEVAPTVIRDIDIDAFTLTLPLDYNQAALVHGSAVELERLAYRIIAALRDELDRIATINASH